MDMIKILTATNLIDEDIVKESSIAHDTPLINPNDNPHPDFYFNTKTSE